MPYWRKGKVSWVSRMELSQRHVHLYCGHAMEPGLRKCLSDTNSCKLIHGRGKYFFLFKPSGFMKLMRNILNLEIVSKRSLWVSQVFLINCAAGFLSDNWLGRRKTILWFSLAHIAFSFGTAFAQSFGAFLAIRFFVGGSIHAVWSR